MKKAFIFVNLFILLFSSTLLAQSPAGYVLIVVKPEDAIIRLNDDLFKQKTAHLKLDTGRYIIRSWAAGRELVTDTIFVKENTPLLYRKKLGYTEEYKKYRVKKLSYKSQKSSIYVMGGITVASAIYFYLDYAGTVKDANDYRDKANEYKAIYESQTDVNEIIKYRNAFERNKALHEESVDKANSAASRSILYVSAGAVATGVLYVISRKITKPVFKEIPLLSDLSFNYDFNQASSGPRVLFYKRF